MTHPWFRSTPGLNTLTLTLHIQPNARRSEISGVHGEALKIKIAAVAVDGQANAKLLKFLAEIFDVPVRQVSLLQGEHSRHKVVEIQGSSLDPASLIREV